MISSTNYERIENTIKRELCRSINKHGMWDGYKFHQMLGKIRDEFEEVNTAYTEGDYSGPHGMYNELAQVSACCIKTMNQIIEREGK